IQGSLPGMPTALDFFLTPATWNVPFPASSAISVPANQMLPTPKPLDPLLGLITDGELRPPRTVAERLTDAMAMLRQLHVSFDALDVEGLALGAGQSVAKVSLRDVVLGAGFSRPAYLRELCRRLEDRAARPGVAPADKATIDARLVKIRAELK